VQRVLAAKDGSPAQVQLADGRAVLAPKGVVVAVEGPEAWRLLGDAMDVSAGSSNSSSHPVKHIMLVHGGASVAVHDARG